MTRDPRTGVLVCEPGEHSAKIFSTSASSTMRGKESLAKLVKLLNCEHQEEGEHDMEMNISEWVFRNF